jgi:hypothetical protein
MDVTLIVVFWFVTLSKLELEFLAALKTSLVLWIVTTSSSPPETEDVYFSVTLENAYTT